jgi:hypothetical protein
MAQPHLLRLRAGRDVGLPFFMRCLNHADVLMVGVRGVLGETVGTGEGLGLCTWGNGGQSFGFTNARWSGTCTQAFSAERVQTDCIGTSEAVGCFFVEHRWLSCSCCEVGALVAIEVFVTMSNYLQLRWNRGVPEWTSCQGGQKDHARNVLLQRCGGWRRGKWCQCTCRITVSFSWACSREYQVGVPISWKR